MKRTALLIFITVMFISSCTPRIESVRTVYINNEEFLVDRANDLITHKDETYKFSVTYDRTTITYPDNSTYWSAHSHDNFGGFGGWSDDYDESKYTSGSTLMYALQISSSPARRPLNIFPALLFIAIGIWCIISPQSSWYLRHGWKYKNAEPSDTALSLTRLGGGIAILIGIIVAFI